MDAGYEITGLNANELLTQLEGAPKKALTYLSLLDGRKLAEALSDQTGKTFRVPIEAELMEAFELLGDKLSERNWEWTETKAGPSSGRYILCSLFDTRQVSYSPEYRFYNFAVRLVEDLPDGLHAGGMQAGK